MSYTRPAERIPGRGAADGGARTPWQAWAWAAVLALVGGGAAAMPLAGAALILVAAFLGGLWAIMRWPHLGVALLLAFLPFYPATRAFLLMVKAPAPLLQVYGMWPELVLAAGFVGLLIQCSVHRRRLRVYWFDLPVLLLLGVVFYAGVLSYQENQYVSIIYGVHGCVMPLAFYLLARWTLTDRARGDFVLRVWLATFAVLCVLSLFEYLVKPDIFVNMVEAMRPGMSTGYSPQWYWRWYPRMYSLLYSEQPWGTLCSMVLLFYLAVLPDMKPRRRWLLHGAAVLAFVGLAFSMSRGGVIFLAVGVFCLLLLPGRHRRMVGVAVCASVALACVLFAVFASDPRLNIAVARMAAFANKGDELHTSRQSQVDVALTAFELVPSGRGLGMAGSSFYHTGGDSLGAVTDSGYFNQLAEQGVVGILGFVMAILVQFAVFIQMYWGGAARNRALTAAAMAMLCGMITQNIGGNLFQMYFIAPLFWVLAGIVTSRHLVDGVRPLGAVRAQRSPGGPAPEREPAALPPPA